MSLDEIIKYIKICDNVDFHLIFDEVRKRHNNKMLCEVKK